VRFLFLAVIEKVAVPARFDSKTALLPTNVKYNREKVKKMFFLALTKEVTIIT